MTFVAITLSLVLLGLSLLHLFWCVRGIVSSVVVPSRADGTPVFRPGRLASLVVAIALFVAALLVVADARLVTVGVSSRVLRVGLWLVAFTFAMRTVGDFRYVGLYKRVHGTVFARWDTRLFTPLCAVISLAAGLVAWGRR